MHDELATEGLVHEIDILGVNNTGAESGIPDMCLNRDLPLLQDTAPVNVWGTWHVTYRDVFVLDWDNRVVAIYNLTVHDLAQPANYEELKSVLREVAGVPE
jgi:hypothetical protein